MPNLTDLRNQIIVLLQNRNLSYTAVKTAQEGLLQFTKEEQFLQLIERLNQEINKK